MLIFLFLIYYVQRLFQYGHLPRWVVVVLIVSIFGLLVLGVRQLAIWFFSGVILLRTHASYSGMPHLRVKVSRLYLFVALVLCVGGIVSGYRANREVSLDRGVFDIAWYALLWETGYTYLGGLNVVALVEKGQSHLGASLFDFFGLMVPSFLWEGRSGLMQFKIFVEDSALDTLGTVHILGELYYSTGSYWGLLVFYFVFYFIVDSIVLCLKKKDYRFYMPLIVYAQIFLCLYLVRGGAASAMKLLVMYGGGVMLCLCCASIIARRGNYYAQ